MSKYTKRPWKAQCMGSEGSIVWMDGKNEKQHFRIGMVADCTARPFDESNANARLIASAPELLELLRKILKFGSGLIDDKEIEQAIAKAEGRVWI